MPSNIAQGAEIPTRVSMTAGAFSGLMTRLVTAPIDVVKIRMQLQQSKHYETVLSTVRTIYQNEGITAFWKGNIPAEIMYLMYGMSQFTTYAWLNTKFGSLEKRAGIKIDPNLHSLLLGSLSGCVATCVSYPFDLLRTRLASYQSRQMMSAAEEIKRIMLAKGFSGFFGGGGLSMVYTATSAGLSFGSYTFLKQHTESTPIEPFCGLLAGTFSKTCMYPLDLLRHRRQVSTKKTAAEMAKEIMMSEGPRGFYYGLIPAILKSAPATMCSFYFYEHACTWLMRYCSDTSSPSHSGPNSPN